MSEAGRIGRMWEGLAGYKSGWKKLVKERMDHLYVYERQLAHWYVWRDGEEWLVKNEKRVNEDWSGLNARWMWVRGLVVSFVGGW